VGEIRRNEQTRVLDRRIDYLIYDLWFVKSGQYNCSDSSLRWNEHLPEINAMLIPNDRWRCCRLLAWECLLTDIICTTTYARRNHSDNVIDTSYDWWAAPVSFEPFCHHRNQTRSDNSPWLCNIQHNNTQQRLSPFVYFLLLSHNTWNVPRSLISKHTPKTALVRLPTLWYTCRNLAPFWNQFRFSNSQRPTENYWTV
jgi:hypothetical protein